MAVKIKYYARENTKVGTHSFYGQPLPNGTLDFESLCEEACMDNTYSVEEMQGCVSRFMKTARMNLLKGFRIELGKKFVTLYPNLQVSVKDYEDEKTHELVVATAKMLSAANAKSRIGATVNPDFSAEFSRNVSWVKTDATGTPVDDEDDATQTNEEASQQGGSDNQGGNGGGNTDGDENLEG